MFYTTKASQSNLDYGFLLLTHLVCADGQIHSEESKYLQELGDRAKISQATKDEMQKILAQDDHHLTLDYITKQVPLIKRLNTLRQILSVAYADDFLSSSEREMINRIADIWNLPTWSRDWISRATEFAPKTIKSQIKQLKREIPLISKSEYEGAIQRCTKIANEDYKYTKIALDDTVSTLNNLDQNLQQVIEQIQAKTDTNSNAKSAKEVAKQLLESKEYLTTQIIQEIGKVTESLHAKQRAINYFTIAFMGRTKAGKSTLHSIITQDGWDSIGVGKQRTTRFNRVYEFDNIRIIDTPGIGAAAEGGREDERVAKSIVDEADVICYVVTNDSIQEAEFQFLKLLKEKAKPLIILLNIKYNLRDSRRLEHFLKNPDKLFAEDGKSGIGGHIERIRRYAHQYYANDYFPIVPVMLLAAQLASEPEHKENKDKLFQASRIQNFLDSIRESLIESGTIRRSQTFLGSTVGSIQEPHQWITQQIEMYRELSDTLKNKQQTINKEIQQAQTDALEIQQQKIETVFNQAFNTIRSFAEKHWKERDENRLNRAWKQELKWIGFEQCIQNANQEAVQQFKDRVKESLEEIGRELELVSQISSSNFSLKNQDSFDIPNLFKIFGGSILGLVALFITSFNPIFLSVGIIGVAASLISGLFKSREQKRREAVSKLYSSINSQLKQQRRSILNKANSNFNNYCFNTSNNIDQYFNELIQGLEAIANKLEDAQRILNAKAYYLNYGYAKRIVDWATEKNKTLTIETANKTIAKVERDFGRSIEIKTKHNVVLKKSLDEMTQVLQEDISITS